MQERVRSPFNAESAEQEEQEVQEVQEKNKPVCLLRVLRASALKSPEGPRLLKA